MLMLMSIMYMLMFMFMLRLNYVNIILDLHWQVCYLWRHSWHHNFFKPPAR
jgi:hypothetical protein